MKIQVSMKTRAVDASHEIWIGEKIVDRALKSLPRGSKAILFWDEALKSQQTHFSKALKRAGIDLTASIALKAAEDLKGLKKLYPLYGELLKHRADRQTLIFALGGGVIGDAIGFVAATYLRGVPWIGVPTTLLAVVDSSIGGKTAVNHEAGKNLVGAFHQPKLIIGETTYLKSLGARDRISGLGEMVKYGLIMDKKFFEEIEKNWKQILAFKESALVPSLLQCARLKAKVVAEDEFDRKGLREILNFGHTLGHAFEGVLGYGKLRHGEAVILGMRAAARLSWMRGHLDERSYERVENLLRLFPMPTLPKNFDARMLLPYVKKDKKLEKGKVRFVLLKAIGKTVSDRNVGDEEMLEAVRFILGKKK
jgi:3-dehydroquinate synthase